MDHEPRRGRRQNATSLPRQIPEYQANTPGTSISLTCLIPIIWKWWITAWSVAAITVAWVLGTWPDVRTVGAVPVLNGCAIIVVFSLVATLAARVLFRAATQADQAAAAALEAQRQEAMAQARDEERRQQFKVLHDNVLHTLESIPAARWGSEASKLGKRACATWTTCAG